VGREDADQIRSPPQEQIRGFNDLGSQSTGFLIQDSTKPLHNIGPLR
jgi:hypothetical protein